MIRHINISKIKDLTPHVSDNELGMPVYIMCDQPEICDLCGSRTFFDDIDEVAQLHKCINQDCGYCFIVVPDSDEAE